MNHFVITYRNKHDSTYQSRYESFTRKLKQIAIRGYWDETSSFYAFEADVTTGELSDQLCFNTLFNCNTDMVVIIDLKNRNKAASGDIADPSRLDQCIGF